MYLGSFVVDRYLVILVRVLSGKKCRECWLDLDKEAAWLQGNLIWYLSMDAAGLLVQGTYRD